MRLDAMPAQSCWSDWSASEQLRADSGRRRDSGETSGPSFLDVSTVNFCALDPPQPSEAGPERRLESYAGT
jgi:hypothetical protein